MPELRHTCNFLVETIYAPFVSRLSLTNAEGVNAMGRVSGDTLKSAEFAEAFAAPSFTFLCHSRSSRRAHIDSSFAEYQILGRLDF